MQGLLSRSVRFCQVPGPGPGTWRKEQPRTAAEPPGVARLVRMRIVGGTHRGARIFAPKGLETRPTGDRVREAAFTLVGPVDGASVLDLFAGSGAMGL